MSIRYLTWQCICTSTHQRLNRKLAYTSLYCYHSNVELNSERDHSTQALGRIVPKIGLEVHAQLKLSSKLFSQGVFSYEGQPNDNLDLLDVALPGSLPKLNLSAVEGAVLTALGLNCTIQNDIHFDRKNYFYSDMPSGYQITQYNKPIARDGFIDFTVRSHHKSLIAHSQNYDLVRCLYWKDRFKDDDPNPYTKRSFIKQIQLEQDSAKTLTINETEQNCLIDYNRSGCALIEIVFEPDLISHHEASSVIKELIRILKTLDTCECELEHGTLRVDANVSIQSIDGRAQDQPKRVELKNLNSLKSLNRAILYEIKRQAGLISRGQQVIQESRVYLTQKNETKPMRLKEDAVDYRYVPEPSIPPLALTNDLVSAIRNNMPEDLPQNLRALLAREYKLEPLVLDEVLQEPGLCKYFASVAKDMDADNSNLTADFLIYSIANLKQLTGCGSSSRFLFDSEFTRNVPSDTMRTLVELAIKGEISFATAFKILTILNQGSDSPDVRELVNKLDWYQITDLERVSKACEEPLRLMKNISKQYRKKGERKYLHMMLEKICDTSHGRVSVAKAIEFIDSVLRPPKLK